MDAISPACCPTCGAALREQFAWDEERRIFLGNGVAVQFTSRQADIVGTLWRTRNTGGLPDLKTFAERAFAGDPDGGPESSTYISVQLAHIRKKLEPTGFTVTKSAGRPRRGFRLVRATA